MIKLFWNTHNQRKSNSDDKKIIKKEEMDYGWGLYHKKNSDKWIYEILKKIEVEGISGGNSVKVIMNGDGELKKIYLDENLLKESKEIVEDLIVAAHNDAKSKLKKKTSEEISKVTGDVSLPPGFKLPF